MPRAEAGTTKAIGNKLKSKGLQRLRWYCQVCEKQCRDQNGFKCHTQAESHVRNMMLIGEDPRKAINDYSSMFQKDFIQQLRTAHGTKGININHFYQEYIAHKEHVHMNSTKWPSLTEFAKFLGRDGICRVEETDKGIIIAWIDNSPEALRRTEAVRRKERMEKGDEEREQKLIQEQILRAQRDTQQADDLDDEAKTLQRTDGQKITLSFGTKIAPPKAPTLPQGPEAGKATDEKVLLDSSERTQTITPPAEDLAKPTAATKVSFGAGVVGKPKNVFSTKKNPLASKKSSSIEQPKKISEAERIMKEEMEKKRPRQSSTFDGPGTKKPRLA